MQHKVIALNGINKKRMLNALFNITDKYLIWLLLGISILIMSLTISHFFNIKNLINLTLSSSVLGIMVIAATLPFLIGMFDLSIESTMAFSAMIGGMLVTRQVDSSIAIIATLLVGVVIGAINGVFIVYIQVNPFIQTLSMNIIFRGMIFIVQGGVPYSGFPDSYRVLGASAILGLPTPIYLLFLTYLVFIILLQRTPWGVKIYAIGQNSRAAYESGINVKRNTILVFILAGFLASFSGLILSTRLNSIDYNVGLGMVFEVFAAAVIGGISLNGGVGSLFGAIGGVLFLSCLSSILTWLNISIYWVETARGFIILFALMVDALKNKLRTLLYSI